MIRVLLPAALWQEITACAVLGAAAGAVRAFFPVRGRGAFVPDVLLAGAVLLGSQSYAAGYSSAGVLRWYMVLAAFAAALAAAGLLGLPGRLLRRFVLQPLRVRRAARRQRHKSRRNAERTAKNPKKNLPNRRRMLYNSNVSK